MIDEVAEVKKYMSGQPPEEQSRLYRACYMISKLMKADGESPVDAVSFIRDWLNGHKTNGLNLLQCVNAAYINETELHSGCRVFVSETDAQNIVDHAPTETDRKVALALLCNAKAFADRRGVFRASTEQLANWLDMKGANVRGRNIRRLCEWQYIAKVDTDKGKAAGRFSKYRRSVSCFKLLVPYKNTGEHELIDNDIEALYAALRLGSR